jgi:molecular chaperone DnaK
LEIDLTFEISESRELKVQAYVNPSGPEFSEIFSITNRGVLVDALSEEVEVLEERLATEQREAIDNENYEAADKLKKLRAYTEQLQAEVEHLTPDIVTDERYQLDDRKRRISQELYQLTSGKRLEQLRDRYRNAKAWITQIVDESGNDSERYQLREIINQEQAFLHSSNPQKLESAIDRLYRISYPILRRTPQFLLDWFADLVASREKLNDQMQARTLIAAGQRYVEDKDYDRLAEVNERLQSLLPRRAEDAEEKRSYTRIH